MKIAKKMEKVTIITPSYNSEKYIKETINSVLNQTYVHWEMIIVDDCSTDDTVSILENYQKKDKRIKYFVNPENKGAAFSRNIGLDNASGRFISFIDSDDLWLPKKLEKQVSFMLEKNVPISFTSYELITEEGVSKKIIYESVRSIGYKGYLKNTIIGMSTSMIDTKLVSSFSFKNLRTRQDAFLWMTLLKRGHKAYGIKKVLVKYRLRNNSISANKFQAIKKIWFLYFRLEKLGFFKSLYYLSFYALNAFKKRYLKLKFK